MGLKPYIFPTVLKVLDALLGGFLDLLSKVLRLSGVLQTGAIETNFYFGEVVNPSLLPTISVKHELQPMLLSTRRSFTSRHAECVISVVDWQDVNLKNGELPDGT